MTPGADPHDFSCRECAHSAGTIHIERKGQDTWLIVSSFVGRMQLRVDTDATGAIESALAQTDLSSLYRQDPEFVPFYCPPCDCCYCGDHWAYWNEFEDGGWFDSTRGRCPVGHERMLRD